MSRIGNSPVPLPSGVEVKINGSEVSVEGAKGTLQRTFDSRITFNMGDGEVEEGQVWEAAHVAARYGVDNLIGIFDHNKLQQFGWRVDSASDRLPPEEPGDLVARFTA